MPPETDHLPPMIRWVVASVARHLLTSVGTLLGGVGAILPDQESQFVTVGLGIVLWGAGFAWSVAEKKLITNAATAPQVQP